MNTPNRKMKIKNKQPANLGTDVNMLTKIILERTLHQVGMAQPDQRQF